MWLLISSVWMYVLIGFFSVWVYVFIVFILFGCVYLFFFSV